MKEKVDKDYLKSFNIGYEIAKELNLKVPMFKNQNINNRANNPIQSGMLQYINEDSIALKIQQSNPKEKVMDKNKGKGQTM